MVRNSGGVLFLVMLLSIFGAMRSNSPRDVTDARKTREVTATMAATKPDASKTTPEQRLTLFIRNSLSSATAGSTQFVIALAPDPVHTHLALFFDRTIDAIQEGAQDEHYLFTAAMMPWHVGQNSKGGRDDGAADEEQWPGVIVFRGSGAERKPDLVMFVVGERPTNGIVTEQFRNTFKIMVNIAGRPPDELRIVGPMFTGSVPLLGKLVQEAESRFGSFREKTVFSGTVTGIGTRTPLPGVNFVSFTENDAYVIKHTIDFVRKLGFSASQIALLSEDGTAYGTSCISKRPCEETNSNTGRRDLSDQIVQLYFPREISQLRAAYQAADVGQQQTTGREPTNLPLDLEPTGREDTSVSIFSSKQTPLSQESVLMGLVSELRFHGARFVIVRATDPLDQLFLARYLRTAYPVGRVIVIGSDLLFTREIQDARLHGIVVATTYPNYPGWMHLLHEGTKHSDRVFPSSLSSGTYNACRAVLSKDLHMNKDGEFVVRHPERLNGYGWPVIELRSHPSQAPAHGTLAPPPVHFAVLGHDGFWPLDIGWGEQKPELSERAPAVASTLPLFQRNPESQPDSSGGNNGQTESERTYEHKMPAQWQFLQAVVILIALGYMVALATASTADPDGTIAQLARVNHDQRAWVICLLDLLFIGILLTTLWPVWALPAHESKALWLTHVLVTIGLFAIAIVDQVIRNQKAAACVLAAGSLLLAYSGYRASVGTSYHHFQFVYRSVNLISGISPVFPILLLIAAACWWAWYTISGSALADERCPQLPRMVATRSEWSIGVEEAAKTAAVAASETAAPRSAVPILPDDIKPVSGGCDGEPKTDGIDAVRSILAEDNDELRKLVSASPFDLRIFGPLFVLAFFAVLLVDYRHPVLTVETMRYNKVVALLFLLATLTLVGTTLRLRRIWLEAKHLLVALDSQRLRRAFRRIKGLYPQPNLAGRRRKFLRLPSHGQPRVRIRAVCHKLARNHAI